MDRRSFRADGGSNGQAAGRIWVRVGRLANGLTGKEFAAPVMRDADCALSARHPAERRRDRTALRLPGRAPAYHRATVKAGNPANPACREP